MGLVPCCSAVANDAKISGERVDRSIFLLSIHIIYFLSYMPLLQNVVLELYWLLMTHSPLLRVDGGRGL